MHAGATCGGFPGAETGLTSAMREAAELQSDRGMRTYERAAARSGTDEALGLEDGESGGDCRPAGVVHGDQGALGWEAIAWLELAATDLASQLVGELGVEWLRTVWI
jgi:hypothetical protein